MDLRKNMLWAFALIGMLIAGSAATIYVSSDTAARAELEKADGMQKGECAVTEIEKTVESIGDMETSPIYATFLLSYLDNGEQASYYGQIEVANESDATVKQAIEKECNTMWAELQHNQEPKQVVIQYQTSVKQQYYDLEEKKWKAK